MTTKRELMCKASNGQLYRYGLYLDEAPDGRLMRSLGVDPDTIESITQTRRAWLVKLSKQKMRERERERAIAKQQQAREFQKHCDKQRAEDKLRT
jgi:hypothetical protein